MLARPLVITNSLPAEQLQPGSILAGGESMLAGAIATIGDGVWTGAAIATGIINRTGPTGAFADVTDSATNILAALAGNSPGADVQPGTSFRVTVRNTVAFADTVTKGTGVVAGTGTMNIAASTVREYLFVVLNASPAVLLSATTVGASTAVVFVLPPGQASLNIGPAVNAINITAGMLVSGTNITAGTKVAGLVYGQGGIIGVTLDTVASGSGTQALTFNPVIEMNSIGTLGL